MSEKNPNSCDHDCSSCSSDCASRGIQKLETNDASQIKKVIAIVSGKGGVGKSTVTGVLAKELHEKGYQVGILDADITGPSIPKMFGLEDPAYAQDNMILPNVNEEGIKVVSSNMLVEDQETPVIWRGPVLNGVIQQFFKDTKWGELDFLLVDMPPGTGDVPLTVFQSIPVDGILIVTTPQELVSMIVMKAVNMAKMMNVPVLGVIENMSYIQCPDCGKKIELFGPSSLPHYENEKELRGLDQLEILSETATLVDQGQIMKSSLHLPKTVECLENL